MASMAKEILAAARLNTAAAMRVAVKAVRSAKPDKLGDIESQLETARLAEMSISAALLAVVAAKQDEPFVTQMQAKMNEMMLHLQSED